MENEWWISSEEYTELTKELEPIVLKFAEKHFHGEALRIEFGFGAVTIEV